MTIFDDEGAPPRLRPYSRAIRIRLNLKRKTVSLLREYDHSPALPTAFEGSLQPLSDGDVFIGWGQQPYFSEDNAHGRQIFDAHFAEPTTSYRAYRLPWSGQPSLSQLAVSASSVGKSALAVYASWNGATQIASWRVLGGASPTALSPLAQAARAGFETRISVSSKPAYYAVQALDAHGTVLGTSAAEAAPG
jgi:Arylsulfotransferase (ASST)